MSFTLWAALVMGAGYVVVSVGFLRAWLRAARLRVERDDARSFAIALEAEIDMAVQLCLDAEEREDLGGWVSSSDILAVFSAAGDEVAEPAEPRTGTTTTGGGS